MPFYTHISHSDSETENIGRILAPELPNGTVLALHGELGTGKTVFTRGIARGLGISEPITSPTFTVVQEYQRPDGNYLFHLDMYRIDNADAALAFGIDDYLFADDGITVVEWPERIEPLLEIESTKDTQSLPSILHFVLQHKSDHERQLQIPICLQPLFERSFK